MKISYKFLFILSSFVFFAGSVIAKETRYPEFGNGRIPQVLAKASEYMVASANPYATEAGLRIIEKGGSAIDAAITVQMVLNLVEPESSGPFFTTRHRGPGLGLPIVSKIAAAHGGSIDISSRTGQGTRVIVRIPVRPVRGL